MYILCIGGLQTLAAKAQCRCSRAGTVSQIMSQCMTMPSAADDESITGAALENQLLLTTCTLDTTLKAAQAVIARGQQSRAAQDILAMTDALSGQCAPRLVAL
jgi:hypothetical protein